MPLDLTALGETVRRVYDKKVAEGVYTQSPILDMVEKQDHIQPGADGRINIFKQFGAGESNIPEGGTYNTAGSFGYSTAAYTIKNAVIPVKVSGSALASTQEGQPQKSAFKAIEEAMKRGTQYLGLVNERQLHGFSNAYIAQCGTTTASATVVLNTAGGDYDGKQAIVRGWLAVGKKVDIGTAANETAVVADATITAVDPSAGTITIDSPAVTTSNLHYVSVQNARAGATSYEMSGLGSLVDSTGTVGGIAYTDGVYWQSAKDSTNTSLSLANFRDLDRSVRQTVGVGPDTILVGFKQAAKLQALAETQIQWSSIDAAKVGDPFAGKYQIFDGKKIVVSHNCHDHRAYLLTLDDFVLLEQNKPSWKFPQVGSPSDIFVADNTSDNVLAAIRHYRELCVRRRCTHGVFTNLTA